MTELATIGHVFGLVSCGVVGVVVVHVACVAATRSCRLPGSAVLLGLLVVGGVVLLGRGLESLPEAVAAPLKIGAVCLYLAGCVMYVELRSLLSRGYSLRILLDLGGHPDGALIQHIPSTYGNGVGLTTMVRRRLEGLARLRLLALEGDRVGPLTSVGRLCAMVGSRARRILRLEMVG